MAKNYKIISFGEEVLREKAKPVTVYHKKLHALIDELASTLAARSDGAALAAPQAGILKRITVINYQGEYLELVNPEIIERKGEQTDYEGCLSYSGFFGKVTRAETITVKYNDRFGEEHIIERSGKMARCIQHELDHLDGILFIDRMTDDELISGNSEEKYSRVDALKIAGQAPESFNN